MTKINDNGTERDMTAAEQAKYDAWAAVAQQEQAAAAQAAAEKAAAAASGRAKLAALGLTDDEINALLGA
jgi:hypothetical protein